MKQFLAALAATTAVLMCGSPAFAQSEGYVDVPGGSPPPLLEVTKSGRLIYGGDVSYECAIVGSGIVMPDENSSPETRAELERTNERAVALCTEAGFPPAGTGHEALPDTGGGPLVAVAAVGFAASLLCIRRIVR